MAPRWPRIATRRPKCPPKDGLVWQISAYMQCDTVYMRFIQAAGKQQQTYTHGNGMQQQFWHCSQNKGKAYCQMHLYSLPCEGPHCGGVCAQRSRRERERERERDIYIYTHTFIYPIALRADTAAVGPSPGS